MEWVWWVMSPFIPSISNCLAFCQQARMGERSWIKNKERKGKEGGVGGLSLGVV